MRLPAAHAADRGQSRLERAPQRLGGLGAASRSCFAAPGRLGFTRGDAHAAAASRAASVEACAAPGCRARAARSARSRMMHGMTAIAVRAVAAQNAIPYPEAAAPRLWAPLSAR